MISHKRKPKIDYFKLFYSEIAALTIITIIYLVALSNSGSSGVTSPALKAVPYIYNHYQDLNDRPIQSAIIATYYILSIGVLLISQYFYLTGRGKLRFASKKMFYLIGILGVLVLWAWLIGRESGVPLHSLKMHASGSFGIYIIPIVLPSMQFIISILLLTERQT